MKPCRPTSLWLSILTLAAVSVSAAGPSAGSAAAPPPEPEPALEVGFVSGPKHEPLAELVLLRAEFDVEVWSGTALVRLTQEFENHAADAGEVSWTARTRGSLDVLRVEHVGSRGPHEVALADVRIDPTEEERARAASRSTARRRVIDPSVVDVDPRTLRTLEALLARQPEPFVSDTGTTTVRSEPVVLDEDATVVVRTHYRTAVPLTGRTFRLALPEIRDLVPPRATPVPPVPVRVRLTIAGEEPLDSVDSPTHGVLVDFEGDRTIVETVRPEIPASPPFVLEFARTGKDRATVAGYVRTDADGRRGIEAIVTPPEAVEAERIRAKELVFLVDSSGSMEQEQKIDEARQAVRHCLGRLRETDRFNVLEFDTGFTTFRPQAVVATPANVEAAERWLEAVEAGGGTRMLSALEAALAFEEDATRHRMLVAVTDGQLQDIDEVLALLERELGERRLFVVGAGRLHRQYNLLRLAEYGRGAATFTGQRDSLEAAITELYDAISNPLGWDLEIDWNGGRIDEIVPSRIPDLYAGRPVRVLAWSDGELPSGLRLRMRTTEGERHFEVNLAPGAR